MKTLVVLILLCIMYVNADYCLTDTVAEGSPFTITQYVDKSDVVDGVITWKYESANGVTVTAMTCDINNNPPCPSTSLYTGTMATYGSTKCKVTLTVKSMSRLRDQATWSWYGGSMNSIGQCVLPVYSFQSYHECDENIHLSSDGSDVVWTCIVHEVYPEMDCQFQYRKGTSGNFMSVSSYRVTFNKDTTDGDYPPRSVYHTYICVMHQPISTLTGAGSYQFMFRGAVRVNVKGGMKTEFTEIGPKTLTLAHPQVELVDCPTPQDYIKEGDTKTCGCVIKTQGNPPGQPLWLDSNGNLVGNDVNNGVNYMSLKYNSQDQNPTYTCRGVSPLGYGPDVTYTPKFAYGPSQISVSLNSNNKVINKCVETTSFTTYCDIAMFNVNPKPTMIVTSSDGGLITPQQESTLSGFYRYKYKVVPKGGGTPTITCQAANAIFSDLKTTKSKTITVQEPPASAPVMTATISNNEQTVENGGIVTVTSGDTVQVKCRVDGGFPGVSKVTTVCSGVTNVNNGLEATQTVNAKKEDNYKKCSCEADHVTGCYRKTSEFTLNVLYTPSMTGYKANSESQKLTVSDNGTVTFVCDVEGNPRPTVSVKGRMSRETVTLRNNPSGAYGQRVTGSKVMSCQDTDEYRCVADNGVGDGVARTVSVFVECVPELPSGFIQTVKEFASINGTDLKVTIPIIGYPKPKEYTLTKGGNQKRGRRKRALMGDVIIDERFYNVTYVLDQPPKGKVVLTMFGLTSSDSGQYVLNIDNGIGTGFDYTCNVTIAAEKEDDDDSSGHLWIGVGIGLAVAIILLVICVIGLVKVRKTRLSKEKKEATVYRMSQLSQQQQQQQQQHEPQVQEEEGDNYAEIEDYDWLNVNNISAASGRQTDWSQEYVYDVPKNSSQLQRAPLSTQEIQQDVNNNAYNNDEDDEPERPQRRSQGYMNVVPKVSSQQQQQQHQEEASFHNQRIQLDDNTTVGANVTHQKKPQRYLNVTISPQGMDNTTTKDSSLQTTSPGIYETVSTDPWYNVDNAYVEADSTTGETDNQSQCRPNSNGYLTPIEIKQSNPYATVI